MALTARNAASLAVLVAVLASPLAVAAQSRAVDAKPKRPHTAQRRIRPQAPSGRARGAARGGGRAEGGSQVAMNPNAVVRWEDQDGTVHYTRAYQVPRRFRSKARHVHATVGTVPLDRAEKGKSSASLDSPVSAADLPMKRLPPGPALSSASGTPRLPSGASEEPTTSPQPTSGADAVR